MCWRRAAAFKGAERAVDEFINLAGSKTPTGASRPLANRAAVQKEISQAVAKLTAAKALTRQYIDDAYTAAETTGRLSLAHKSQLRLAAAHNTWSAVEVVDALYHAAGGTAIYHKSKFQQCFRDIHVTTQHIMVGQPIFEVTGKVLLGIDPRQPL